MYGGYQLNKKAVDKLTDLIEARLGEAIAKAVTKTET